MNILLKNMLVWLILLGVTCGLVLYCSRPQAGTLPAPDQLSPSTLHLQRQALWIRIDSLKTWLDPLQAQTNIFDWKETNDALVFEPTSDPKDFAALFFGDIPLSTFAQLKDPAVKILPQNKGFEAKIETKNNIRVVYLPAHVVQSIQLFKENR